MIRYLQHMKSETDMARPLSANSRKVLVQLGKSAKSIDELSARTGIRRDKLAKLLWHLLGLGWIAVTEEVRRLPVYRRLREMPAGKRPAGRRAAPASHIAALNAAFGIGVPPKRARGRMVRRGD
jgi:hypothetical protein